MSDNIVSLGIGKRQKRKIVRGASRFRAAKVREEEARERDRRENKGQK